MATCYYHCQGSFQRDQEPLVAPASRGDQKAIAFVDDATFASMPLLERPQAKAMDGALVAGDEVLSQLFPSLTRRIHCGRP